MLEMVADLDIDDRQREDLVSFLRRLLSELEAGRAVQAALHLQAFIDELEERERQGSLMESRGPEQAPGPSSPSPRILSGMVAESIWS